MPEQARCVIIGGGAMGAGLLYALAHEGWTDTILVEKGELTSGSTWHAAGLIPNFIGDLNMAKCHQEAIALYPRLEAETGLSAGWHGCGALRLARTADEADWHHYVHAMLTQIGVESYLIGPNEIAERHPLLTDLSDVRLGFYTPNDGWTDPSSCTNAMAKGARDLGCRIMRHTLVTGMSQRADGTWDVTIVRGGAEPGRRRNGSNGDDEQDTIHCEHVVNAAGHYAPQLGAMIGLDVPIVSVIHQYLVTESVPAVAALEAELPVVRDPRASCYYRQEIDGLLIGPYEMSGARSYGIDGIDWDLHFHLPGQDLDVLEECLDFAQQRIGALSEAGIKQVVSGPITHTPDSGYLMGPAPGVRNYWHCNGASIGITQGPGAGRFLAQWIVHGQTEINVRGMDPRRFGDHTGPKSQFAFEKAIDEYHEMYQVRLPGEQRAAGRPVKSTPLWERFDALGAQWQEIYGWERPQYFSPDGSPEAHSFRRSNAHDVVGAEVRGVRERVGVADLSAFAKFEVSGPDAAALLDRLSANRLPGRDGGIRLTHMLTELGGIECEMTIARLAPDRFWLASAIMGESHDLDWLRDHVEAGEQVSVRDATDATAILGVTGPRARDVLAPLTDADLGNDAFSWLTAQQITVAGVPVIALRVSYVGELGWELHCPMGDLGRLYDAVAEAGSPHGLVHFGSYAMNVMRIEKAYKAWGSELTTEITPVEARLGRFVDYQRPFVGRDAAAARRESEDRGEPLSMVLVYCEVDATDNEVRGNEPAFATGSDEPMGIGTSGAWGHTVGRSLAFVYVDPRFEASGSTFELDLLGERRTATVLAEAAYDPANKALRA
ncbi:FAD-dependent oxidoreductase [Candidatus Poriferisodalis sp.]|uniref:FAD-dependent oxidoreductase n=1 Tax=Candidatus Poriferisodalis sp. TaxID=3101277 RepID=UPI003C6FE93E